MYATRAFMPLMLWQCATCNAQLLFTNAVSKWHGSVRDSAVFHSIAFLASAHGK